ncbi:hypothetical protein AX17_005495 [Amanita inopinata Kibby_2008]|nr:hypothetical protein AX17_005495 [Amanita inopinata Kibby_2008]
MSSLTKEQGHLLRDSITHPLPFCSGTLQVSADDLLLFYGGDENACRLNLQRPPEDSLRRLTDACDPATFGVGNENVYDESYRKAGKLSSKAFRPFLDLTNLGLPNLIRDRLLRGQAAKKLVRAELYNLNIYGEGSFFKAHRDTPRGRNMFGSLVITYPTLYQGGALIIRQDDKEWTVDSSRLLSGHEEPYITYVALYSDVEHEVSLVTSGYRVTITYNLYLDDPVPELPDTLSTGGSAFKSTFEALLNDPEFLPDGGYLGFGLEYSYPLPVPEDDGTSLDDVVDYLKGSDAEIWQVANELLLDVSVWSLIEGDGFQMMCEGILPGYAGFRLGRYDFHPEIDIEDWLVDEHNAKVIQGSCMDPDRDFNLSWVTMPAKENKNKLMYTAYGNEPSLTFAYNSICIVVQIGKPGKRAILA